MSHTISAPPSLAGGLIERLWGPLRARLLRIQASETEVRRRGFEVPDDGMRLHLESIGAAFVTGYNEAVSRGELDSLVGILEEVEPALRGFAYEGASMGLYVSDALTPGRNLWPAFLCGPASAHEYICLVGCGWALARLPWHPLWAVEKMGTPLKWLVLDGYGFHEGFFHWRRFIDMQERKPWPQEYALHAFDQGLGRSLWFVRGAQPERIAQAIAAFDPQRHRDLWSGVGLALAYAGGLDAAGIGKLQAVSSGFSAELAQGVVFGAEARARAGNPAPHTELACLTICGLSQAQAAQLAREHMPSRLDPDPTGAAYEAWRAGIRRKFQ